MDEWLELNRALWDTLSLHRLGARMSGLDFSSTSIEEARSLAARAGAEIDYVVARTVAGLLKPGGRLHIRDGHPMLLTMESAGLPQPALRYPYFARPEPLIWDEAGTYVETEHRFAATRSAEFSHALSETVTALLDAGLRLTLLAEHDSVPWEALPGFMTRDEHEEYRLSDRPERLAASFTLQAVKEA